MSVFYRFFRINLSAICLFNVYEAQFYLSLKISLSESLVDGSRLISSVKTAIADRKIAIVNALNRMNANM